MVRMQCLLLIWEQIACYRFVTERGFRFQDHMKIMAYDGTDFTRMMMPVMTAVRQDITKLASSCADVVRLVQRKSLCVCIGLLMWNFKKVEQHNVSIMCNVHIWKRFYNV